MSFFLVSSIGIVLYTMYVAFHYSSSVVLSRDEANFIILSSQKILATGSFSEFVRAFFPSHGQHTLLGMQLVNMATYFSVGALDRKVMNLIGVVILSIAALLLLAGRSRNRTEIILLCATLFPWILSPTHNVCSVNASCTGNHYFGIAASVATLYFFTRATEKKIFFVCAELFMLLAVFSLPASLAIVPISFLVLAQTGTKNKRYVMGAHLAFIVLMLVLHSYLTYPNTIFAFTQNTGQTSLPDFFTGIVMFVITFFIIAGSMFYWLADMNYRWVLIVVGMVVSLCIVTVILKTRRTKHHNAHSFAFYGLLLFLVMILIICFGRFYSLGSSRYSVYTAFLYAMLFMVWFNGINATDDMALAARRTKILFCSSALSLIYFFTALHYHQPYLFDIEQRDIACKKLWVTDGYVCGVMIKHEEATRIIRSAIDQGIYRIEQ